MVQGVFQVRVYSSFNHVSLVSYSLICLYTVHHLSHSLSLLPYSLTSSMSDAQPFMPPLHHCSMSVQCFLSWFCVSLFSLYLSVCLSCLLSVCVFLSVCNQTFPSCFLNQPISVQPNTLFTCFTHAQPH